MSERLGVITLAAGTAAAWRGHVNTALVVLGSVTPPRLMECPSCVMDSRGCGVDTDQVSIKHPAEIGFCFGNGK